MTDDIKERLRALGISGEEGAERIEALEALAANKNAALNEAMAHVEKLDAQLAAAREANFEMENAKAPDEFQTAWDRLSTALGKATQ